MKKYICICIRFLILEVIIITYFSLSYSCYFFHTLLLKYCFIHSRFIFIRILKIYSQSVIYFLSLLLNNIETHFYHLSFWKFGANLSAISDGIIVFVVGVLWMETQTIFWALTFLKLSVSSFRCSHAAFI